jgi:hypothetical protein
LLPPIANNSIAVSYNFITHIFDAFLLSFPTNLLLLWTSLQDEASTEVELALWQRLFILYWTQISKNEVMATGSSFVLPEHDLP